MSKPLTVMISYSWHDAVAADLLHEELALRGVYVLRDKSSFSPGTRISTAMREAVANCDGYVAYFTPSSLYETSPDGPRPMIDEEFLPVMDRMASNRPPVIMPLVHSLGDPRTDAMDRVRGATGRDISSLWMPIVLDQSTEQLTQAEASLVAVAMIEALVHTHIDRLEPLELSLTTRGAGQVPAVLSVDATSILGGVDPRPGRTADWIRYHRGVGDLERTLAAETRDRKLLVVPRAHLTAAFAIGRTFHQAAGWTLVVPGRFGDTSFDHGGSTDAVEVSVDLGVLKGDVAVELDLLGGVGVSALAAAVLAEAPRAASTRVVARRRAEGELHPPDVAAAAALVAREVRAVVHDRRPSLVHMFCAAPVEFAVLVGCRLTSLHAKVQLYERDGERYLPSLVLEC